MRNNSLTPAFVFMGCIFAFLVWFCVSMALEQPNFELHKKQAAKNPDQQIELQNVVRVMMHRDDEWTFITQEDNKLVTNVFYNVEAELVMDAPADKPMFVTGYRILYHRMKDSRKSYPSVLQIHLHSPKDIEGGGWERKTGKTSYEKGQTQAIE